MLHIPNRNLKKLSRLPHSALCINQENKDDEECLTYHIVHYIDAYFISKDINVFMNICLAKRMSSVYRHHWFKRIFHSRNAAEYSGA